MAGRVPISILTANEGNRNDVIQWDYETIAGSNPTDADEAAFSDDSADVLAKRAPHSTFGTKSEFDTERYLVM